MDPNLFYIDWERLFEVLISIIIFAFFVERALALVFESHLYTNRVKKYRLKEFIAFALSYYVCWQWDFDAISIIFVQETVMIPGLIITAAIIAGGSKASIALFKNLRIIKGQAQGNSNDDKQNKP